MAAGVRNLFRFAVAALRKAADWRASRLAGRKWDTAAPSSLMPSIVTTAAAHFEAAEDPLLSTSLAHD